MASVTKPRVLFYHNFFFGKSETFVYRQVINPYIQPILLAGRYFQLEEMPTESFTKFKIKRPLTDKLISKFSKWIGKHRPYYGNKSLSRLKRLLKGQSFDVIHAQFGGNGVRILPLAKELNIPLTVTFHGFDASKKLANNHYRKNLKDLFDYASAIVVVNTGMADVLPLSEAHKKKVRWVPSGIDIEQFSTKPSLEQTNSFNILHVGRLVEKKGVPDLIRAFATATKEVDEMILHVVGGGLQENECKALAKKLNLESKVIFHGWKSPAQVKELMQQCDIFVLNSRIDSDGDTEGLPVGILEAMAMSKPVISTRHAGIPLAIENEVSGVLVNERDTDSLSKQILRLYHNKELRLSLGKAARKKAEDRFTVERMHENLRDIYYEISNKQS